MAPLVLLLLLGGAAVVAASSSSGPAPKPVTTRSRGVGSALAPKSRGFGGVQVVSDLDYYRQHRPAPDSQPKDVFDYLNGHASPFDVYPEWPWLWNTDAHKETAWRASWDLSPGDHVDWWVNFDGTFGYHHTWGGFDLGRTLESAANALGVVASALGFVGAQQLVLLLHALAGHGSPDQIAHALKAEFDNLQSSGRLAEAVESGDWAKAWDAATDNGKKLGALSAAWNGHPPDREGKVK